MPNQPRESNRGRNIRVESFLWEKAKHRATERGETVSDAIRRFLQQYSR